MDVAWVRSKNSSRRLDEAARRQHTVVIALGGKVLQGPDFGMKPSKLERVSGAPIFDYWVLNPSAYGVVEFGALAGPSCR